jgi:putative glutamine amidotransferase
MARKPLIGMNCDYRGSNQGTPAYAFLAAGYFDAICKAGGIPVVLPPTEDLDNIGSILDSLDGFVLVGGADLDPRRDGYMLHSSVRPMDARREDFDRRLAREISQRRMSLMAIGAGLQLINIIEGGDLFYHIPIDLPNALPHLDPHDPNHRHSLVVEPNSILGRVYGEGEIRVTSRHHMAIDRLADAFKVTARCQDGVIEGIESKSDDWFVVGCQFHPESPAASALDGQIFEEFIEGILSRTAESATLELKAA